MTEALPVDAGASESERFWEGLYRHGGGHGSGRPNAVLASVAGSLRPGAALDLGCGAGDDAIWLAARGWRVTAVDLSATAVARVAERNLDRRLRVRAQQDRWTGPGGASRPRSTCGTASLRPDP